MENFFTTLGYGLLALLGVATVVAFWEQWRSRQVAGFLPTLAPSGVAAVHRLDIDLSALEPLHSSSDRVERQATVDGAMQRMARAPTSADDPAFWIETRPMVAPGETVQGAAN